MTRAQDHLRHLIGYPFPLRDGSFGYIYLPAEISSDDARRLAAMAASLVFDPDEAAGPPPPTPAPTRDWVEEFRRALLRRHADDWDMDTVADAAHACAEHLLALLTAEPAPPLWTGETLHIWAATNLPDQSHIPNLPVPPGTAVEGPGDRPARSAHRR